MDFLDLKRARALADGLETVEAVDSNECLHFRPLSHSHVSEVNEKGLEGVGDFGPLMSHQIYGQDELIRGYVNPRVDIYLSPMFLPYVQTSYESRVSDDGIATTDLVKPLKEAFGESTLQLEREAFFEKMREEEKLGLQMEDLGERVLTRTIEKDGKQSTLGIFQSTLADASETVKKLHARIEPLLLFFIDCAAAIDAEDPSWEVFLVTLQDEDGNIEIVGMCTVYVFYVYPDKKRFRVAQVFVLPTQQGKGIGSAIVDAVFEVAKNKGVVDITLEDPTDDFRRIRDRKDLHEMLTQEWIVSMAKDALGSLGSKASTPNPLSAPTEAIDRLCSTLMMNKKQAQRMWESLLYKVASDMGNEATAAVEGYIAKTLEEMFVGGAKDDSENKVVVDTPTGFVMYKSKTKMTIPGNIPPVEEVTREQQRATIADYVAGRVAEIQRLLGLSVDQH
ncbi:hypothetical protein M9435_000285 [Picochlorum sp. BPE23]|nr:hypothetical protein M9435_000285 [Picochlorum sp. BPE23]